MKCSRGFAFLALCVVAGATTVDGAFWNRKKDGDKADQAASPSAGYAPALVEGEQPVQSLSSLPVQRPAAAAIVVPPPTTPSVKPGRRAHFLMQDEESVDTLVRLADSRQLREEELRVLVRLLAEKEGELGRMNERLLDRFGIAADANYQYDNETKSLFLLVAREGVEAAAGASAEDLFEKSLHMTLRDKKSEVEFVRLVSAKKITASELQVLKLLIKEKNLELKKVNSTLAERFAVSADKHYEYDADARILYEVVSPAGAMSGANPGR